MQRGNQPLRCVNGSQLVANCHTNAMMRLEKEQEGKAESEHWMENHSKEARRGESQRDKKK